MKFYLVRPYDDSSSIFIDVNYKKNRLRASTGIVISTNAWDESKELATRKDINYTAINSNLILIMSRA